MKKVLIVTNILCIGIICFMYFKKPVLPAAPVIPNNKSTYCTTCTDDLVGHTAWEFASVVARYKKTHWNVINSNVGTIPGNLNMIHDQESYEDARSVWFPLDTIKKFICNIEKYSGEINVTSSKLGIRFYYATYPGYFTDYPERSARHTIFMAPTIKVEGDSEAADFDPRLTAQTYISSGTPTIQYLANLIDSTSTTPLLVCGPPAENYRSGFSYPNISSTPATSNNVSSFTWNSGRLCPTNCPLNYNTLTSIDNLYPGGLNYNQ